MNQFFYVPKTIRTESMQALLFAAMKIFVIAAFSVFLARIVPLMYDAPTITLALLLVGELITIAIVIFSRPPKTIKLSFVTCISSLAATFYFFFIALDGGRSVVPIWIGESLQCAGILVQISAKIYLGRSFGLVPANRGVITTGPYRLVRHPIYCGYLISHIGYLVANFTVTNLLLYVVLYLFQSIRIWQEEKLLSQDQSYKIYMDTTKYRVIPGII